MLIVDSVEASDFRIGSLVQVETRACVFFVRQNPSKKSRTPGTKKWSSGMALVSPLQQITALNFLQTRRNPFYCLPVTTTISFPRSLVIEAARANTRKESAKVRNRRLQKKFNGSAARPRLSVFCSTKQLYAMLVDDHNKKCLFYASTLQRSIRESPSCTTMEAAQRVGEELVKACVELNINEISSYDRNGCSRGERMQAFETAIAKHGLLPR